jgi:hypothetical protein
MKLQSAYPLRGGVSVLSILVITFTLGACGGGSGGGGSKSDPAPISLQAIDKVLTGNADEDLSGDVSVGDTLTYTITATNTGTADLTNVLVSDDLTGDSSSCALVAPAATCVLTTSYVVTVADMTAGEISNTGSADSDQTSTVSDVENVTVSQMLTLSNFQAAEVVIGQADFTGTGSNQGGTPDGNTISAPFGNPGIANGVLYLPEWFNSRVLGFNAIPTVNNDFADFVLGQPDFTTNTDGLSATQYGGPQTVAFDGGKMFLIDFDNQRALIWNSIPTAGGAAADVVIGQADFTSNATSCSNSGLNDPETLWAVAGKLIVTDSSNNRVLIWNTVPTANNAPADIVLGQQSFSNCAANDSNDDGASDTATASTLSYPAGVWSDGTRLVVLDADNNRVLIWNSFPISDFAPADLVLGQSNFSNVTENDDNQDGVADTPSARTLFAPFDGVYSNGEQLFITDIDNHRVLIWNSFPTSNFAPADVVLGQSAFSNVTANDDDQNGVTDAASARTLNAPAGILQVGNQLIVADQLNNRYLIYNGQ